MKKLALNALRFYYKHADLLEGDYFKLHQMIEWMKEQPATGTDAEWEAKARYEDTMDELAAVKFKLDELGNEERELIIRAEKIRLKLGDDYAPDPN